MKYTIKITYQGGRQNHLACCLSKLDDSINPTVRAGWATREEACEHLYATLHDVAEEFGCEMIDRNGGKFWFATNYSGQSYALESREDAKNRAEQLGEDWDFELDLGAYLGDVRDYILREGWATEDGVAATVEAVEDEPELQPITSYKCYSGNVTIYTADGSCDLTLFNGCDFGGATWTDEEAEADAREILRDHGIDDTTADHYLISTIAAQFPRD